jgi:hypothetical protein
MAHVKLLKDRSNGLEAVIVVVVPLVFGLVTGIMLGVSEPVYLVLSLLGILGGFGAGLEHEYALEGFYRGLLGGLLFGFGILLAHGIADVAPKAELLEPEVVLIAITATFGAGLGALGGRVRERRSRRTAVAGERAPAAMG